MRMRVKVGKINLGQATPSRERGRVGLRWSQRDALPRQRAVDNSLEEMSGGLTLRAC